MPHFPKKLKCTLIVCGHSHQLYPNSGVYTNAHRPSLFTSTGAGGRKMRGGVLGLALVWLSATSNDGFRTP
jgi:hypothetical protein